MVERNSKYVHDCLLVEIRFCFQWIGYWYVNEKRNLSSDGGSIQFIVY